MGVIYVNGGFKKSVQPVKGGGASGGISEDTLKDYATKTQLEEVKNSIDTHEVTDENLIIE